MATAVERRIELLRSTHNQVRLFAALALAHPDAAAAVPALIQVLGDCVPAIRWNAVFALGRIGPAAVAAVPALYEVWLNDADDHVRKETVLALGRISSAPTEVADCPTGE